MAWLSGWPKRIKLVVDSGDIDAALENFPIMVHLGISIGRNNDDVSCVFDELESDANRKKIAITTSDGVTQCHCEIEKWVDADEEAWLWVKVPNIASGADTDLYLYYDKTKDDNDSYVGDSNSTPAENVWDEHFMGVWHMANGADNAHIYDSTSNNNDGTKGVPGEPTEVDGQIAKAQDYDGSDDFIGVSDAPTLGNMAALTIEALIERTEAAPAGSDHIVSNWISAYHFGLSGGKVYITMWTDDGQGPNIIGTNIIDNDVPYYLAGTYDGSIMKVYLDGSFENDGSHTGDIRAANFVKIGAGGAYPGAWDAYLFHGLIDEVRISDIARNAPWIKATKESLWDNLLSFGSEERIVPVRAMHLMRMRRA